TENHRKAGEIYHLILIQNAQVQNSQDELLRAIDTITSGLTAVQESTISEVRRLKIFAEGAGSRNKENQLNRLTDSFLKIPEMLGKVNLITDELKTSVQSVLPLVNELLLFSEQIDKISAEIKLIALNASVKAARAGIEGRGLGVLADAIQELSVDAEGIIHSIMSILEKVKEKTTSHASLLNENDGSESLRTITEQITANVGYFRTMDQNVLSGLEQMNKSVQELDTQIANALKSLHLQTVVSSSLSAASSHLSNIAGIIEAEFNLEHVTAADLKRLRDNYSMEREREIHDSILFDTDAPVSEGYQHNDTGSGEYGDNVELF
ncbi:partial Methyl-accepting chemotaxis protein McpA, partial [Candidatus Brocadiaceae bacterium]